MVHRTYRKKYGQRKEGAGLPASFALPASRLPAIVQAHNLECYWPGADAGGCGFRFGPLLELGFRERRLLLSRVVLVEVGLRRPSRRPSFTSAIRQRAVLVGVVTSRNVSSVAQRVAGVVAVRLHGASAGGRRRRAWRSREGSSSCGGFLYWALFCVVTGRACRSSSRANPNGVPQGLVAGSSLNKWFMTARLIFCGRATSATGAIRPFFRSREVRCLAREPCRSFTQHAGRLLQVPSEVPLPPCHLSPCNNTERPGEQSRCVLVWQVMRTRKVPARGPRDVGAGVTHRPRRRPHGLHASYRARNEGRNRPRRATGRTPAYLIEQEDGDNVLKSHSEVTHVHAERQSSPNISGSNRLFRRHLGLPAPFSDRDARIAFSGPTGAPR